MRPTVAIIRRELSARREVWLVAVAAAVFATLSPFVPGLDGYDPTDVLAVATGALALVVGWGLAVGLGATLFGSDLVAGRLGFFFARPVTGWSVWWGRILAMILLVIGCELVVLLPMVVGGWAEILDAGTELVWPGLVGLVVIPILLLLVAHAAGIMLRARTAWLFLDLVGVLAVVAAGWLTLRPLLRLVAVDASLVVAGMLVASLALALALAGFFGIAVGRVDLRRVHAVQSLVLWGLLTVCVAGVSAYSSWLRDFEPSLFDDVEVLSVAPDGRWVEVLGQAPGRLDVRRRCLVSTFDSTWLPLPSGGWIYEAELAFSPDGTAAVWRSAGAGSQPQEVWWADLSADDPVARKTNILISPDFGVAVSSDGGRIAVVEDGLLSVYDLRDESLLKAVRLPEDLRHTTVLFLSRNTLKLFSRTGPSTDVVLQLAELDVVSGRIARIAAIDGFNGRPWIAVDGGVRSLVAWTRVEPGKGQESPEKRVFDTSDGTLIKRLALTGFPRFLDDGRLVAVSAAVDGQNLLIVESIEDGERKVYEMGEIEDFRLAGEARPNEVVISRLADPQDRLQGMRVELFDVDTGQSQIIGSHLRRGFPWAPWQAGDGGVVFWYAAQSAASRLFLNQDGALVRWDPDSGKLVYVVGGRE